MQDNWKSKIKSHEEYVKTIKEMAKDAPSGEEILAEFERGDFSALGDWNTASEAEKEDFRKGLKEVEKLAKMSPQKRREFIANKDKETEVST